jgi:hypothetical protein
MLISFPKIVDDPDFPSQAEHTRQRIQQMRQERVDAGITMAAAQPASVASPQPSGGAAVEESGSDADSAGRVDDMQQFDPPSEATSGSVFMDAAAFARSHRFEADALTHSAASEEVATFSSPAVSSLLSAFGATRGHLGRIQHELDELETAVVAASRPAAPASPHTLRQVAQRARAVKVLVSDADSHLGLTLAAHNAPDSHGCAVCR